MRRYTVKQATLTYRFEFKKVLSVLPVPGTDAFSRLCDVYRPFGFTPNSFVVEAPIGANTRLSDVGVAIGLFTERFIVRVRYGWFDVFINSLQWQDIPATEAVLEATFAALRENDSASTAGDSRVVLAMHVETEDAQPHQYIRERFRDSAEGEIVPDGFGCRLRPQIETVKAVHVVVAESLVFQKALFLETSIDFEGPAQKGQLTGVASKELDAALAALGLRPIEEHKSA